MAAPSRPTVLLPPVAEVQTPAGEGGSSAGRASSPEDLLTVCVAQEPLPILAQAGPIEEETCCLLLLSSSSVSVLVKSSKQEEAAVHICSKVLHGTELHLDIKTRHVTLSNITYTGKIVLA